MFFVAKSKMEHCRQPTMRLLFWNWKAFRLVSCRHRRERKRWLSALRGYSRIRVQPLCRQHLYRACGGVDAGKTNGVIDIRSRNSKSCDRECANGCREGSYRLIFCDHNPAALLYWQQPYFDRKKAMNAHEEARERLLDLVLGAVALDEIEAARQALWD